MDKSSSNQSSTPWPLVIGIIIVVVAMLLWFLLDEPAQKESKPSEPTVVEVEQPVEPEPIPLPEPPIEPEVVVPEPVEPIAPEPTKPLLPTLNESDQWLQEKLPSITWRKELLKLVIDDDMIRRFVVFTDNFSQGLLAYEHSPLIKPTTSFSAKEINEDDQIVIKWDETTSRRFSLYVDLLRSVDTDTLVSWYFELKPLINEAYRELGYPEENFTDILQDSITKVLDMEIPKERLELVRPSVMYQFKDESYESLDDAEKLMLRIGKENLLVIKSVLLEISEKLSRARENQEND
ncbi:DUF3014 domain-containing protein [Thalassotalea sp. 1_MG-2023]|uniref:DUF3014 domain-containing protein n=1 Tax=Thalassotalea sp. 1_MG-2023 TaxID=3062680 RepID=UPI0026E1752C|nr:DUF3014 domain-containing protein [Thalassotalea sp. 1_MG-2023]MDO6428000.1 DUF3014 domain-containing protein [Thalassotalea sp. 1_MG-2023]